MRKNPMPSPFKVFARIHMETLGQIFLGLATVFALFVLFLTSGCEDGKQQVPRPHCDDIMDLTRHVVTIMEVRQHCVVTQDTKGDNAQKRTCKEGTIGELSMEGRPVMFEITISGQLRAVRLDPPGAHVGVTYKTKDNLTWTATIVAADEALFSRAKVGDTVALCPWREQMYAYELPDMGILSKLEDEPPKQVVEHPGCDQPPCEGEGEGATLKPPLAASTRFLTKSGLPLAESIDEK